MSSQFHPKTKKDFIYLIIILGSIIAIGPLTIDIYLPAFGAIAKTFEAKESLVQLSLTTYFIGIAFGQILYGPIIDRYGKKPPLFFGLSLFFIASVACFYATSIEQIIVFRFFQALGACAGTVIPRSIVRDIFPPQESARVFSHLVLVMGVAPIMAPLIGNLILTFFDWRIIFAFLAAFGIFCLAITHFYIPETKGFNPDEKISHAFRKYWGILHDKNFIIQTLTGGMMTAALFSYITGSPFLYLDFFGLSSRDYGIIFSINSLGFVAASQLNARLLKKFSIEKLLGKIIFMPAIAGLILIFVSTNSSDFWLINILFFIILCSCGMIVPNTTALTLANQAKHSGSAAALMGTIQFSLAAIASFSVSKFYNGEALPIALVIGSCTSLSFLIHKISSRDSQQLSQ